MRQLPPPLFRNCVLRWIITFIKRPIMAKQSGFIKIIYFKLELSCISTSRVWSFTYTSIPIVLVKKKKNHHDILGTLVRYSLTETYRFSEIRRKGFVFSAMTFNNIIIRYIYMHRYKKKYIYMHTYIHTYTSWDPGKKGLSRLCIVFNINIINFKKSHGWIVTI